MKLKIQQKELIKHINIAQRAIATHTTMQVLEGIQLIAKDEMLELIATDLKISVFSKVKADIFEEGSIIIHSNLFGNIIRKLPNDEITMIVEENQLNISCQNSSFQILGFEDDEYPQVVKDEEGQHICMSAELLKESISQTVFATSQELTKPVLTGVLMNKKKNKIDFVALDGYRIALKTLKYQDKEESQVIIPAKSLQELSRILPEEGDIEISILTGNVLFSFENTKFYTRLLEGSFIQYESVISSNHSTEFIVQRRLLEDAIDRASLLSREDRTNLIKLDLSDGRLTITSNAEIGHVKEIVDGEQRGENIKIAFNARYLMEGIKATSAMEIKMKFSGPLRACIVEENIENPDFLYVVLPVKLAE